MLGGRAAEQTVFGIETTGASNDIERATDLARKMVMQYGMSDRIGLMALIRRRATSTSTASPTPTAPRRRPPPRTRRSASS